MKAIYLNILRIHICMIGDAYKGYSQLWNVQIIPITYLKDLIKNWKVSYYTLSLVIKRKVEVSYITKKVSYLTHKNHTQAKKVILKRKT